MRLIGTKSLSAGQTLAMPVCTSSGKVILNSGVVLDNNYINRLLSLGFQRVYIKDD